MSEADWGEEGRPARAGQGNSSARFPAWIWWGCGGGCLLATLAMGAAGMFGWRMFQQSKDPEQQWPRLDEVLAFDERPAQLELGFGVAMGAIGANLFHLFDHQKALQVTLIEYPSSTGSDYQELMDPQFAVMGLGRLVEPEHGTLVVQGREVPGVRFLRVTPEPEDGGPGAGIRIDLTGDRAKPRTLELRRRGALRIEDAEVAAFLVPFDVWRAP